MDPKLYERSTAELTGRLLFGTPSRLRLGMWIASLPGKPHTFTQKQFWDYCERADWPERGRSQLGNLQRFHLLEMVEPRPDLSKGRRVKYWTKQPSPLWRIFKGAVEGIGMGGAVLVDDYVPTDERIELEKANLLDLLRELDG